MLLAVSCSEVDIIKCNSKLRNKMGKKKPTIHELGGRAKLEKYGRKAYVEMARKRWEKEKIKKSK